MVKYIPLSKGKVTIVDDDVYEWASKLSWYANQRTSGHWYARRGVYNAVTKKYTQECMHRILTNCPKGMVVDHINGDSLDNRQANLRVCTVAENVANKRKNRNCKAKYKGVTLVKAMKSNPWRATLEKAGKQIHLGYFPTQEAAAHAYNDAAKMYHGEFACLNEVEKQP